MTLPIQLVIGLIGAVVTLGIFVLTISFKMGHHSARIESLEKWRDNIRIDMHEISDKLENISKQMTTLTTLIEERTDRRLSTRPSE